MRRSTARRELIIEVPAERVWSAVTRAELLHLWFPGMEASDVEGDQRTVVLGSGIRMAETLLANDPLQRRFQYRIAGGLFQEHLGTVDVIELGPDRCLVVYATDAAPAVMSIVLGGATLGAMVELKRQLESGTGPIVDALDALATEEVG